MLMLMTGCGGSADHSANSGAQNGSGGATSISHAGQTNSSKAGGSSSIDESGGAASGTVGTVGSGGHTGGTSTSLVVSTGGAVSTVGTGGAVNTGGAVYTGGAVGLGGAANTGGVFGTLAGRCLTSAGGKLGQAGADACPALGSEAVDAECAAIDLPAHLMAYYPLNGNTADASPSPNPSPGVIAPSPIGDVPWTSDRKGNPRAAMHFDGRTSVDIPNSDRLNGMTAFTLAAWVNPEATDDGIILSKVTPNRDFVMKLQPEQGGTLGAHFAINYNEYYFVYTTQTPLLKGAWAFVAAVWTGCRWGLYLNGYAVGERVVTNGSKPAWTGNLLQIGNSAAGAIGFRGTIYDVRVYDKALTGSELLWLMQQ